MASYRISKGLETCETWYDSGSTLLPKRFWLTRRLIGVSTAVPSMISNPTGDIQLTYNGVRLVATASHEVGCRVWFYIFYGIIIVGEVRSYSCELGTSLRETASSLCEGHHRKRAATPTVARAVVKSYQSR